MESTLPPLTATAFDLSLVSREQIIRLADKTIAGSQNPPEWLLELSCLPADASPYDFYRLLPQFTEPSDEEFLALLAYGRKRSLLAPEKISALLMERFCDVAEITPLQQSIYVYDDELDWDPQRAQNTLSTILNPYVATGEILMAAINSA